MFLCLFLTLCFIQVSISSAQTNATVGQPLLASVQPVPNNDTALNFTFSFPANPQYATLTANYTLYEFSDPTNELVYLVYSSLTQSCGVSTPPLCVSSAVPEVSLGVGHYVIGCFQWLLFDTASNSLGDAHDCILGRTTINSSPAPIASIATDGLWMTNDSITVCAAYPAELPYDTVTITPTLNGTISAAASNATANASYSLIQTSIFTNLMPDTTYWLCFNIVSSHSAIAASQETFNTCQWVKTAVTTAGGSNSNGTNTGNNNGNGGGNGGGNGASTLNLCNYSSMILLLMFAWFL